MKKLTFKTEIDAPASSVWETLFGIETYPQWTSVFSEGSKVETDWKEGSKALFSDGNGHGMVAVIHKALPYEYLSIKHLGEFKDGVEDLESEKVKEWAGAMENYTLISNNGVTELTIDIDTVDSFEDYFEKTWPLALEKVKEITEKHAQSV
jgi:uncharacterized protein YndB with AHSA1/START domain